MTDFTCAGLAEPVRPAYNECRYGPTESPKLHAVAHRFDRRVAYPSTHALSLARSVRPGPFLFSSQATIQIPASCPLVEPVNIEAAAEGMTIV